MLKCVEYDVPPPHDVWMPVAGWSSSFSVRFRLWVVRVLVLADLKICLISDYMSRISLTVFTSDSRDSYRGGARPKPFSSFIRASTVDRPYINRTSTVRLGFIYGLLLVNLLW